MIEKLEFHLERFLERLAESFPQFGAYPWLQTDSLDFLADPVRRLQQSFVRILSPAALLFLSEGKRWNQTLLWTYVNG